MASASGPQLVVAAAGRGFAHGSEILQGEQPQHQLGIGVAQLLGGIARAGQQGGGVVGGGLPVHLGAGGFQNGAGRVLGESVLLGHVPHPGIGHVLLIFRHQHRGSLRGGGGISLHGGFAAQPGGAAGEGQSRRQDQQGPPAAKFVVMQHGECSFLSLMTSS